MPRVVVCCLAVGAFAASLLCLPERGWAQEKSERDEYQRLRSVKISTASLREEMPLEKLLAELEQQPKVKGKYSFRIDKEAFGADFDQLRTAPVQLQKLPEEAFLTSVLYRAVLKNKVKADWRLDGREVVITTPARALVSRTYEIKDILSNPGCLAALEGFHASPREKDPARVLLRMIIKSDEIIPGGPGDKERAAMEVIDEARLVVRTRQERHESVFSLLAALRRMNEVSLTVQGRLYEVDDDFYKRLKNAKSISLDEAERLFLEGKETPGIFEQLPKQKLLFAGPEVAAAEGAEVVLISRTQALSCQPSRLQMQIWDQKMLEHAGSQKVASPEPQIYFDAVSFRCSCKVRPDRRGVVARITEQAEDPQIWHDKTPGLEGRDVDIDEVFARQRTSTRDSVLPDGGTTLIALNYQPPAARKANRHWVLAVQANIFLIDDFRGFAAAMVPRLLDDIGTNPRLQPLRTMYGTADDKKVALLDSPAWTWHENPTLPAGYGREQARRDGKRLLGIRLESVREDRERSGYLVTVHLSNAGGSDNGAAIGTTSLRYRLTAPTREVGGEDKPATAKLLD